MTRYASFTAAEVVSGLLEKGVAQAVLVPSRQPYGKGIMQTLVDDPGEAAGAEPLAPVAPSSSATILGKLTRQEGHPKLAAFLRPCEVRAFLELAKLKQASTEGVLLVGVDCYGRYENTDYAKYVAPEEDSTLAFLKAAHAGGGAFAPSGADLAAACKGCETPVADNVDLRVVVIGADPAEGLRLEAVTPAGEAALEALGMDTVDAPAGRDEAVAALVEKRRAYKEGVRGELREQVKSIDGLMSVISSCINCYNCRSACPVCYCRECVFATDTFSHESKQYFDWAQKRGTLRMPSDTLFYHLTRMAHMSTLCVGCGQCTSACPNDIPVSDLFGVVAEGTQKVFGYVPGRDPEEGQPLATFFDDELPEVTGQTK